MERYKEESKNEYAKIKRKLVEQIIKKRIYKTEDLNQLHDKTMRQHSSLDISKLETMWEEIISELNA